MNINEDLANKAKKAVKEMEKTGEQKKALQEKKFFLITKKYWEENKEKEFIIPIQQIGQFYIVQIGM